MNKDNKVVLIYDEDLDNESSYNAALVGSGFHINCVHTEKDFFAYAHKAYPDILVINSKVTEGTPEAMVKKIKKLPIIQDMGFVYIVEKILFSTRDKMKRLDIESYVDLPLKNNIFLQAVKKVSKKFELPSRELELDEIIVFGVIHSNITEISEMGFIIHTPVKITAGIEVDIHSSIIKKLKIEDETFMTSAEGVFIEAKNYKNFFLFKGLCVNVLREVKEYCIKNRIKQ